MIALEAKELALKKKVDVLKTKISDKITLKCNEGKESLTLNEILPSEVIVYFESEGYEVNINEYSQTIISW